MSKKAAIVVAHTHWDCEWRYPIYTDTSAVSGTTCDYRVRAVNAAGAKFWSRILRSLPSYTPVHLDLYHS